MSSMERCVSSLSLVVVMSSMHRNFYTDQKKRYPYFRYVADELPFSCGKYSTFPRNVKTSIVVGLSMGGMEPWIWWNWGSSMLINKIFPFPGR